MKESCEYMENNTENFGGGGGRGGGILLLKFWFVQCM